MGGRIGGGWRGFGGFGWRFGEVGAEMAGEWLANWWRIAGEFWLAGELLANCWRIGGESQVATQGGGFQDPEIRRQVAKITHQVALTLHLL